jgi:formylglycine-generating enzyme required for sulfatase activity
VGQDRVEDGIVGGSMLVVENVELGKNVFKVGDRILQIDGVNVSSRGDIARLLSTRGVDEKVSVKVQRGDETKELSWVPFPRDLYESADTVLPLELGRVLDFAEQFGITLAGYPLDFRPECLLGETRGGSTLDIRLPAGSYLLLIRQEGFVETRVPVVVPRRTKLHERVQLIKESPLGFVYIPAGPFAHGGDSEAFQSLPAGEAHVDGFFIGRVEVTMGQYLNFINFEGVRDRIDEEGEMVPLLEDTRALLARLSRNREEQDKMTAIKGLPRDTKLDKLLFDLEDDGTWSVEAKYVDLPVLGISQFATREYARWLTLENLHGWKYRLPNNLEWEKAARGADARTYVWGNYLVWIFCWCNWGNYRRAKDRVIGAVGSIAFDKSVYGVRDLDEYTTGQPVEGSRFNSVRGGNWETQDESNFRIANRNGRLSELISRQSDFRLVAELERKSD